LSEITRATSSAIATPIMRQVIDKIIHHVRRTGSYPMHSGRGDREEWQEAYIAFGPSWFSARCGNEMYTMSEICGFRPWKKIKLAFHSIGQEHSEYAAECRTFRLYYCRAQGRHLDIRPRTAQKPCVSRATLATFLSEAVKSHTVWKPYSRVCVKFCVCTLHKIRNPQKLYRVCYNQNISNSTQT
jgi:hypothetical protein